MIIQVKVIKEFFKMNIFLQFINLLFYKNSIVINKYFLYQIVR